MTDDKCLLEHESHLIENFLLYKEIARVNFKGMLASFPWAEVDVLREFKWLKVHFNFAY